MTTGTTSFQAADARFVSGLEPADVRDAYADRALHHWSDARLIAAVAQIVSIPRRDRSNSFILHAPLELSARAALLPRVAPADRELARLRILAVAAQYESFGPPLEIEERPQHDAPAAWVTDAIAAGDEIEAVAAARTLAGESVDHIVDALTDRVAPSTAAAGHAPIFLSYLERGGSWSGPRRELLAPLVRELARQPEWTIRWIDEPRRPADTNADTLNERLSATPILGPPASTFIHPLMMHVDENGFAAAQLGDTLGSYTEEAAQAILRTAARSMLLETCEHAPYGWTHCLTMPQALLGLAPNSQRPDRLLALAATEVLAFRTALGGAQIQTSTPDALPSVDPEVLASAAAISHDAHVVKYVLACIDAAAWDPGEASLYLAAGAHLLDCWSTAGGDPTDPLA